MVRIYFYTLILNVQTIDRSINKISEANGSYSTSIVNKKVYYQRYRSGGSICTLEYAQNVRAMVDIIGVDHVCIGTDTKMTQPYRPVASFSANTGKSNLNNGKDVPQQGSKPAQKDLNGSNNPERIGVQTNGVWKDQMTGFYYTVVEAMLHTGFTEDEIRKIGGGNFCRIFNAATSGH